MAFESFPVFCTGEFNVREYSYVHIYTKEVEPQLDGGEKYYRPHDLTV